jgi:hypothetical protein
VVAVRIDVGPEGGIVVVVAMAVVVVVVGVTAPLRKKGSEEVKVNRRPFSENGSQRGLLLLPTTACLQDHHRPFGKCTTIFFSVTSASPRKKNIQKVLHVCRVQGAMCTTSLARAARLLVPDHEQATRTRSDECSDGMTSHILNSM